MRWGCAGGSRRCRWHRCRGGRGLPRSIAAALLGPPTRSATCSIPSRSPSARAPSAGCGPSIEHRPSGSAVAAYWRFVKTWRGRYPRLVKGLERHLDFLASGLRSAGRNPSEPTHHVPTSSSVPSGSSVTASADRALSDRRSADRILYGQVTRLNELPISTPACRIHTGVLTAPRAAAEGHPEPCVDGYARRSRARVLEGVRTATNSEAYGYTVRSHP